MSTRLDKMTDAELGAIVKPSKYASARWVDRHLWRGRRPYVLWKVNTAGVIVQRIELADRAAAVRFIEDNDGRFLHDEDVTA